MLCHKPPGKLAIASSTPQEASELEELMQEGQQTLDMYQYISKNEKAEKCQGPKRAHWGRERKFSDRTLSRSQRNAVTMDTLESL